MDKQVIAVTEMLTNPSKGIYTQWIYYSDGSMDTVEIPKGPIISPIILPSLTWDF